MTPERFRIADNIELSAIKTNKFKSELLTFTVGLPLTKSNIAHNMLLTSVLKRGTKSYPSLAVLNRRLDELYSSSIDIKSARLGKNLTLTVTADILDSHYIPDNTDVLGNVLDIIAEIFYSPNLIEDMFPYSIVEQEKKFLIEGISSIVNNTRTYATTRLSELVFRNDPEFPTVEELKDIVSAITSETLTDFYRKLWQYSKLRIFHVGNTDQEILAEKIISRFAPWTVQNAVRITPPYAEPVDEYISATEKMPVSQGKLAICFSIDACISQDNDKQYVAMVLNEIFGGSAASKLFMNVREKLSICYYCSSSYDRYTGLISVSSGIESKNRQIAEDAILSELEDIKAGRISETELDAAKKSLLNSYRQMEDNPYDLQGYYANREYFGFTENVEYARNKISEISADSVSQLASEIIRIATFFVEGAEDCEEEEPYDE